MKLRLLAVWIAVSMSGCAVPMAERPAPPGDCPALLAAVDAAVARTGVGDAQAVRIDGFPALRVNRWLASYAGRLTTPAEFDAWIAHLRTLDARARRAELANLPPLEHRRLAGENSAGPALEDRVQRCADRQAAQVIGDPRLRAAVIRAAVVPDEYRTARRAFGLYPLSAILVGHGIADYHAETFATFGRPLATLPRHGVLVRYVPPEARVLSAAHVTDLLASASLNPLRMPQPTPGELERLFAQFAPVFEVDVASEADRIGAPRWSTEPYPRVDTADPVVYRLVSHVRYGGEALLQLNYVIWFPARPPAGRVDILSGHLDGLNWRVTLGSDGRPLLYDAMHNCGCYHMFFPTWRLALHPEIDRGALEPPLVPQQAPVPGAGERLVIRLASRTHYIERVYAARAKEGEVYRFADYDELRSLARPDGSRRSLFGPDGIVPGTERTERWVLWPMGVPAPGAMRQWGHHATAFVGRRHFDDPDLLERLFVPAAQAPR